MGFSDKAPRWVVAAAALFSPVGAAHAACVIAPPGGPFTAALAPSAQPPTESGLPNNPGAWSTWITPGPAHRWDSASGLVDSPDGSLTLHGIASNPTGDSSRLNVYVLADYVARPSTRIVVWNAEREVRLAELTGSRAVAATDGAAVAFDIVLPQDSVPAGGYSEIQTLVWLDGGPVDARRWTVYSGPEPPAAVNCVDLAASIPEMAARTRLDEGGRFVVRAPRATTLAVVPITVNEIGTARFVRVDQAERGGEIALEAGVEIAAVWEDPFAGPAAGWISSFWTVRSP